MKLVSGEWKWDEEVLINVDGKTIKRKVRYDILNGLYIVYKNEKIGLRALTKPNEESL